MSVEEYERDVGFVGKCARCAAPARVDIPETVRTSTYNVRTPQGWEQEKRTRLYRLNAKPPYIQLHQAGSFYPQPDQGFSAPCPTCGEPVRYKRMHVTYSEGVKCGAKCRNATGPNCDCSCRGQNHGRSGGPRSNPEDVQIKAKGSRDAATRYAETHWGLPHTKVIQFEDPDIPFEELPAMGRLVEARIKDGRLSLSLAFGPECWLAFDTGPAERLYFLLTDAFENRLARELWQDDLEVYALPDVARHIGGRQARYPHADLPVQVLGRCTNLVYRTKKRGDDVDFASEDDARRAIDFARQANGAGGRRVVRPPGVRTMGPGSEYIHRQGEEGGIEPALCVSEDGRLWFAGGSYSVPPAGISR